MNRMSKMVLIKNSFLRKKRISSSLEISIIKETLTTTDSTLTLEFTEIVKKDKNDLGHIMISYNHSTKDICSKIAKHLKVRRKKNHFLVLFH